MNPSTLTSHTSALKRYYSTLVTLAANRARCIEKNYSVNKCASIDHKIKWLQICFARSPFATEYCEEIAANEVVLKKPEQLFAIVSIAVIAECKPLLNEVANLINTKSLLMQEPMLEALTWAYTALQSCEKQSAWQVLINSLEPECTLPLQQRVALYTEEASTINWSFEANNLLVHLNSPSPPPVTIEEKAALESAGFTTEDWFVLQYAATVPSMQDWQTLESLELTYPRAIFTIYSVWGGDIALQRIATALESPRLNAAAHTAWCFLTKQPLPILPRLHNALEPEGTQTGQLACHLTAKEWLQRQPKISQTEQCEAQLSILKHALSSNTSVLDDVFWAALFTQLKTPAIPALPKANTIEYRLQLLNNLDHLQTQGTANED